MIEKFRALIKQATDYFFLSEPGKEAEKQAVKEKVSGCTGGSGEEQEAQQDSLLDVRALSAASACASAPAPPAAAALPDSPTAADDDAPFDSPL